MKRNNIYPLIIAVFLLCICLFSGINKSYTAYAEEEPAKDGDSESEEKEKSNDSLSGLLGVLLGGALTLGGSIYATHSNNKQAEIKFIHDDLEKEYEFKRNAYFNFLDSAKKAGTYMASAVEQQLNDELLNELSHQLIWIELSAEESVYDKARQLYEFLTDDASDKPEEDYSNYYKTLRTAMRDDLTQNKPSRILKSGKKSNPTS